jgi:uncharacterized SAM-binding protein YcdF (DUF218 family)
MEKLGELHLAAEETIELTNEELTDYIFLETQELPKKADLILVLGTRIKSGLPLAAGLYAAGRAPRILVTGGINKTTGEREAEVMASELVKRGVPPAALLLEKRATNTLENILFSVDLLREVDLLQSVQKILLVVKNYHARRALMTAKRWFLNEVEFFPLSYNSWGFDRQNWWQKPHGRQAVYGEYAKIQRYLAKGDIAELDNDIF